MDSAREKNEYLGQGTFVQTGIVEAVDDGKNRSEVSANWRTRDAALVASGHQQTVSWSRPLCVPTKCGPWISTSSLR
ncbi:hypothetical protein F751_1516 [Auxenochlorella protothecoides]|uniref:Uncharacterized protein n=1 Tax=Auxenochlorella protothecoides TaxID=3075 RepID=A0A087SJJ8_AUXPR|nr:hypothetical protein F751_1516 [Auxenochlorella protothecoides]KFM25902.1 hypothetical protein F751_1516 [Auxenochlorella protothecoides]